MRTLLLFAYGWVALSTGCSYHPTSPPYFATHKWDTLHVVWSTPKPFNLGGDANSSLRPESIDDTLVIFGFGEGFVCLNANTGVIKWRADLKIWPSNNASWYASDMIIEKGRLYALAGDDAAYTMVSCVVCISVSDGSVIWRHNLEQNQRFAWHWSKSASSPDAIFYSTQQSHVVALSKADGSVLWDSPNGSVKPLTAPIDQGAPCYRNGVVYVGSGINSIDDRSEDGGITALDAKTGALLWQKVIPLADSTSGYSNPKLLNVNNQISVPPVPTADGIIITAGFTIRLMDSTGHIVWTRVPNVDGGISIYNTQSFLIDGKLYGFNNGNGAYFTFEMDAHSGNILWVKNPAADILATANLKSPFIDSNQIYIFSDAFELFGQSLVDGSLSLFTPLLWYTSNIDIPLDPYIVRGRRVYYQTENEIMCIERK